MNLDRWHWPRSIRMALDRIPQDHYGYGIGDIGPDAMGRRRFMLTVFDSTIEIDEEDDENLDADVVLRSQGTEPMIVRDLTQWLDSVNRETT